MEGERKVVVNELYMCKFLIFIYCRPPVFGGLQLEHLALTYNFHYQFTVTAI